VQSVQQLYICLDRHYSDVAVGWTVKTATVLWVVQSVQQLCCDLDCQYFSSFIFGHSVHRLFVDWAVIIAMFLWADSQYSIFVVGWTVIVATLQ